LFGDIDSDDYEAERAADPRIDALRDRMTVTEDPAFTEAFYNVDDPANPHAIQIFYKDGTQSQISEVKYPLGHYSRRDEGKPLLAQKFRKNIAGRLGAETEKKLLAWFGDRAAFEVIAVDDFMAMLAK